MLVLPAVGETVRLAPGQILIKGGRIAAISLDQPLGTPDLGSSRSLISPGFVDTHLHLPQFDSIGYDGLTLLDWLRAAVFPAEAKWADADYAGHMTTRVARRLLSAGTTAIAAYATVHHAGTVAAMRAIGDAGIRGVVGQVLMDQRAPEELLRPALQLLREAAEHRPHCRIQPAVTPRFAVSCTATLLAGAGELARKTGWIVQTHLSETEPECRLVRELHGQSTYTDVYQRAGLLTNRTLLGHSIWLSDAERSLIRSAGSIVAHCPTANLFLQAGSHDLGASVGAGVRMSLGSDIAGGPDVCMVRVARGMIENAKRRRLIDGTTVVPSPGQAWHQMTEGNARAMGFADGARLEVGAVADLVVIDPAIGPAGEPEWLSAPDPLSKVMYAWDERWIRQTLTEGRVSYSATDAA